MCSQPAAAAAAVRGSENYSVVLADHPEKAIKKRPAAATTTTLAGELFVSA
jgi:hypothetical protein